MAQQIEKAVVGDLIVLGNIGLRLVAQAGPAITVRRNIVSLKSASVVAFGDS